jgi:[glutamine synthetase] adenylyltransferase / [glutamine synthetase]-adenylyl-L-tyrosine phosphorylase
VERLPDEERLRTQERGVLVDKARLAVGWRTDPVDQQTALRRWKERHLLGVVARDLEGWADPRQVGGDITALAEASLEVALELQQPKVPVAVIALGRFGGHELSYASDLDIVVAYDGSGAAAAEEGLRVAGGLRRFLQGATPAHRLWDIDLDLRPEGKQGPIARSLDGYRAYFERWALVWERQAMLRARFVAGDPATGAAFDALLEDFVWAPGLSEDDRREIRRVKARMEKERLPTGDDPAFHLKLGKGSLSDVEWTAQLLQLRHGVRATGTLEALDALVAADVMDATDAEVLADSYRACEGLRNRLFLVRSAPGDALPTDPVQLLWLARSLEVTPSDIRERYRRVTRRARAVMERLFSGRA